MTLGTFCGSRLRLLWWDVGVDVLKAKELRFTSLIEVKLLAVKLQLRAHYPAYRLLPKFPGPSSGTPVTTMPLGWIIATQS